jgi:transcriptional regulator with XRE-family HTH domain
MRETLRDRLLEAMKPYQGRPAIRRVDLAEAAQVSKAAVTKWFNADTVPKIKADHLFAIARLCKVRPEWLSDGQGAMRVDSAGLPETQTLYGLEGVTLEAAELGREWQKLDEPLRSTLRDVILMAVAAQKRQKKPRTRRQEPAEIRPGELA